MKDHNKIYMYLEKQKPISLKMVNFGVYRYLKFHNKKWVQQLKGSVEKGQYLAIFG